MNSTKKMTALLLSLIMLCLLLVGCGGDGKGTENTTTTSASVTETQGASTTAWSSTETKDASTTTSSALAQTGVTIRLGGLKGPTSIGMAKLIEDAENGNTANKYEYTMATTADELTPKLLKGELDILAVPMNLGSTLYNKTSGQVKLVSICTLGVLYIVEKGGNTVNSFEDLKGKTIYATGKGTTPEFALNYLLSANGIDMAKDVTIEWKSEPTEIVSIMATKESAFAMMPQPFVTVAQNKFSDLRIALDLTAEWDKLDNMSRLITAGLIVRKEFAEKNPEALNKFIEEFNSSVAYVNGNVEDAAVLVGKLGIVDENIAKKAIPYCNTVCITGNDMKRMTSGYLNVLHSQKPESVGGKLPGDDFYIVNE